MIYTMKARIVSCDMNNIIVHMLYMRILYLALGFTLYTDPVEWLGDVKHIAVTPVSHDANIYFQVCFFSAYINYGRPLLIYMY